MKKTTLGISEYAFAAIVFLAAVGGITPLLVIALYAAAVEKSEVINAQSRIAIIIMAAFEVADDFLGAISNLVNIFSDDLYDFNRVMGKIDSFISVAFVVTMLIFVIINAFRGLAGPRPAMAPVQPMPMQGQVPPQGAAPAANVCPKCGNPLAPGAAFCTVCGNRLQ